MARAPMSLERRHHAAVQAGRQVIARAGRPTYRVSRIPDGRWEVDFPGVELGATERRAALDEAHAAIAVVLDVDPDTFDVVG